MYTAFHPRQPFSISALSRSAYSADTSIMIYPVLQTLIKYDCFSLSGRAQFSRSRLPSPWWRTCVQRTPRTHFLQMIKTRKRHVYSSICRLSQHDSLQYVFYALRKSRLVTADVYLQCLTLHPCTRVSAITDKIGISFVKWSNVKVHLTWYKALDGI